MKLVECVPNFSEGRNLKVIKSITDQVDKVPGVKLLDVDPGADTNRTVVTFIGTPDGVAEAAFQVIKKASEVIDMSKHTGGHARQGATDVCPFVPVAGVTMEACVEIAKKVGKRVGVELEIPIYLYEEAATRPERRSLPDIRVGEYEALSEKLKKPEWKPDFGPAKFNAKAGVTVIGAREFLIAYNVNLNTKDKKLAHDIALTIRERGRFKRDKNKKIVKDENGKKIKVPGLLKECKAVGWYIEEYSQAQISINLTNYNITPIHVAFDVARKEARKRGLRVTGSEIVGLTPKQALLDAGYYYLKKQKRSEAIPESDIIDIAIKSMGLSDITEFCPEKKIIEYQFENDCDKLVGLTIRGFNNILSTDAPAPGGGSVAALCGSMAASLDAMVANLTFGKKRYEKYWNRVNLLGVQAQKLKDEMLDLIDKDTDAFNEVMAAMKVKAKTDDEKKDKDNLIQEKTKNATLIPLTVMKKSLEILQVSKKIIKYGNKNSISDVGVSAVCCEAAAESAYLNVLINLPGIEDKKFKDNTLEEAREIKRNVSLLSKKIIKNLEKSLESEIT
ncbi:glutamate formimidoyltransferase [Candidatus Dependentiae bacterium]|nr:glutamate formimidoyltransferase [Candidatus Dependentiae bacterium]